MPTKLTDAFKVSMQDVNKTVANEYATVTRVNSNKTVNVKPDSNDADSDDLTNISYVVDLDLSVGDRVVLSYLNNDPNEPIIIGMLNPKSSSNVDCRSIVSVDKVESDGLVDVYRITYDKVPIYSYFSVKNGTIGSGVSEELAGKTVRLPVLIDTKTVTNQNSVLFDGLNGDLDKEYRIEWQFDCISNNSDGEIYVQFNSINSNYRCVRAGDEDSGRTGGNFTDRIGCGHITWVNNGSLDGWLKVMNAKIGRHRKVRGFSSWNSDNGVYYAIWEFGGAWLDITTTITSILMGITGNSKFSGTIKLYKMIDVTYPTN